MKDLCRGPLAPKIGFSTCSFTDIKDIMSLALQMHMAAHQTMVPPHFPPALAIQQENTGLCSVILYDTLREREYSVNYPACMRKG